MKLRVALLPEQLSGQWIGSGREFAIVIDTLRFTTTACQAFQAGARSIRIAADINGARSLADQAIEKPLLCGERLCRPIEGFDLGNSPLEFTTARIAGKNLIFTTTNGTRAVRAARCAPHIWLAAMVNRRAVARQLSDLKAEVVWFVCAGTDGEVALEDVLVAGAVIDQLGLEPSCDAAHLARHAWQAITAQATDSTLTDVLQQTFASAQGGRNLIETGYLADVQFATQIDSIHAVPKSTQSWDIFECS